MRRWPVRHILDIISGDTTKTPSPPDCPRVDVARNVTQHAQLHPWEAAPRSGQRARTSRAGTSVSFRLSSRHAFRPVWLVPAALLGLVFLPGCEDKYNDAMRYPVRTDPVFTEPPLLVKEFGEVPEPDRPGQLPLQRPKDFTDQRNPFHEIYRDSDKRKRLEDKLIDPLTALSAEQRTRFQNVLEEAFGKPSAPKIDLQATGAAKAHIDRLRLDDITLKEGAGFYRLHCMQCHGLTGDGRGPTARWVNPHPRDYRPGLFKFQSVNQVGAFRKPRREDLYRTIYEGIEGTTMPSHNMLPEPQIEAVVSYVIFLSIRGYVELQAMQNLQKDVGDYLLAPKKGTKKGKVALTVKTWFDHQDPKLIIKPGAYKINSPKEHTASVLRGQRLFADKCGTCHKDYGRQALYKFDDVGWGILVRPANLTTGVFRGGRRPIDLYWRIHSGINGSGMAAFGKTPPDEEGQSSGDLDSNQIWDLVNFVQALPYPAMRRQHGLKVN